MSIEEKSCKYLYYNISLTAYKDKAKLTISEFPLGDLADLRTVELYIGDESFGRLGYEEGDKFVKVIDPSDARLGDIHNLITLRKGHISKILKYKYVSMNEDYPVLISKIAIKDNYVCLRTSLDKDKVIFTIVPFYEGGDAEGLQYYDEYSRNTSKAKYILFYEKKSETFGESASVLFNKYYKSEENFLFILSKQNPDFNQLKEKYGDQLIEKGSHRYYEVIHDAKMLVSSELPTHVISDRALEYNIVAKLFSLPFIFLQHGIMFSKPIKNPMARGFWKENVKFNLIKTVVSSELEKEEFFKVGYEDSDLIKTGLATLDEVTHSEKTKFVYMPTYRSWEEYLVYNGRFTETTYFEDIKMVIEAFTKAGMVEDLVIVPHPKFSKYLVGYFNKHTVQFETSYTKLRDNIKLFITDFSSASYDAHYRGAYIIYLWNRREELEKNYCYRSPLNDSNCDGVPVYSDYELIEELVEARDRKYELDDYYHRNFKKICEFDDGDNCQRIYTEIKKVEVQIDHEDRTD